MLYILEDLTSVLPQRGSVKFHYLGVIVELIEAAVEYKFETMKTNDKLTYLTETVVSDQGAPMMLQYLRCVYMGMVSSTNTNFIRFIVKINPGFEISCTIPSSEHLKRLFLDLIPGSTLLTCGIFQVHELEGLDSLESTKINFLVDYLHIPPGPNLTQIQYSNIDRLIRATTNNEFKTSDRNDCTDVEKYNILIDLAQSLKK